MSGGVAGAGIACERRGCRATAAGFVCIGMDLKNGEVVAAPYGYRCEEHAREGRLHEDFGEEERKTAGALFARMFNVPTGATMFIGLTKLTVREVEELRGTFDAPAIAARHAAPVDVELRGRSGD